MKNKFLPYVIFGVPLLIGGFFLYKYMKANKKGQDAPPNIEPDNNVEPSKKSSSKKSGSSGSSGSGSGAKASISKYFPLTKGSRGAKVKEVQEALLSYDANILPTYGADSDYGKETRDAVNKVLGKTTIDSQDDIDAIKKKASENKATAENKAKVEVGNANRLDIAKKLVKIFNESPYAYNFYALNTTSVGKGYYTSDGRSITEGNVIKNKGDKLALSHNTKFTINWDGYIEARDGDKWYYLSPYAFEVK
jgi:hypothetical protein